jgi:bifunctional oligoribonuclease and PAP phosphatase NrnA
MAAGPDGYAPSDPLNSSRGASLVVDPIRTAADVLADAADVTLLAHVQPDADSLGSALALGIALHRRGAAVRVAFATPAGMPDTLAPFDVLGLVVPVEALPASPDVLVACDAAEPARLGALEGLLDTARVSIMIDHHVSNPGFGDVQVLDPTAEATVVLVRRVLTALGTPLDVDIARCLYAGLVTDTVGFRAAGEAAHLLAAELVAAGVEPEPLVRSLLDTHPFTWFAALSRALARCVLEPEAAGGLGLVHTVLPASDVAFFRGAEIDSVVDTVRTAAEAEVALVLKQVGERRWSASMRSKGAIDVSRVAARLGGGGHRAAAGFTRDGTLGQVLSEVRWALALPARPLAS